MPLTESVAPFRDYGVLAFDKFAAGFAAFRWCLDRRHITFGQQGPEPENQAQDRYRAGNDCQDNQAKEKGSSHANNSYYAGNDSAQWVSG